MEAEGADIPTTQPLRLTDEPGVRFPRWARAALVALIVLKFVLISHEEIRPYLYDESGFAQAAGEFYWNAHFSEYAYVKPPVYPLFVGATTVLGLPTRLAAELVWALAAWVMARAIWRVGLGGVAAVAAGGLMLFHPWSIEVLNRLFMDSLYAPLFVIFLGATACGLASTSRVELKRWSIVAAVTAALAANTRQESALVYGSLGVALVVIGAQFWKRVADRALALRRGVALVLVPFAAALVLSGAIRTVNYGRIGAWVVCDLDLPGFGSLYSALLAIPSEEPRLNLPVRRDVRLRAYSASPAFAQLRPFLDGPKPAMEFMVACRKTTGERGEYGAWTIWALRDAAWRLRGGQWKSAAELDALYATAARELRAAMRRGELPSRAVIIPFVAPEWGQLASETPGALWRCAWMVLTPSYQRDETVEATGWRLDNFDAVANRRIVPAEASAGQEVEGSAWYGPRVRGRMEEIKGWAGSVVGVSMRVGAIAAAIGLLLRAFVGSRGAASRGFWALAVLLGTALAARLALVALLDMSGILAETRYLLACVPMLIGLEIAGVAGGAQALAELVRSRRSVSAA
jgi:hypothetical protein